MSLLEFVIDFKHPKFSFHIQTHKLSTKYIRNLIGVFFSMDMDIFIMEIFDQRFNKYIILNDFYLSELQSNSYFKTIKSYEIRIRSQKIPVFSMYTDGSDLTSEITPESKLLLIFK